MWDGAAEFSFDTGNVEPAPNVKPTPNVEQNGDNVRRCGARLQNKPGKFCRSRIVMKNGRCRIHGGASPSGEKASGYIDGRICFKNVPQQLAKTYKAIKDDADLTELREDLKLQWSMIETTMKKMDEVSAPPWGKAVEGYNDCVTAKSKEKFEKAFEELGKIIRTGAGAAASYERLEGKLRELILERTDTAKAEWKRRVDQGYLVEMEKVSGWARMVLEALAMEITDKPLLKRVAGRVLELMGPRQNQAIIEGRLAKEQDDGP